MLNWPIKIDGGRKTVQTGGQRMIGVLRQLKLV